MDLAGQTLSHYRIAEEISRGGMGVVYRATDMRLQRDVALKILPDELMHDADLRRRFLQEAQAASAIEHPNVAVIYDADEADGHTFIAMELIRGQKLSDYLAAAHPPVPRVLELATEIASGLARAHEKQIVHRDLKPANVMVTDDGHAKIIDFGIAKLLEPAASTIDETRASQDTGVGVVLGTMSYMSPEQARGDRVDHRSDIFSFGTVLHQMLTGRPPFQGKSGLETASAILHVPAPRLMPLGPEVGGEVTAELQRILDKCLEKDPANRYQGMKDLIVDLRAVRRKLESGTQVVPAVPAISAVPRRSPWPALVAGGVVAVTVLAAVFWRLVMPHPAPTKTASSSTKPSVAVLYFNNSTAAPDLDWLRTGITEMVVTDLSQSPDLEVVSSDRLYGVLASLKRADDKALSPDVINQVAEKTGVDHVIVGSYMKSGDAVRINVQLQDVKTGRIVTSESVEGPSTSSVFGLVDDLSRRLLTKFEGLTPATAPANGLVSAPGTPSGSRGVGQVTTSSIEAFRLYAEAINLHDRFEEADAAALLEKALVIDPSFAMAEAKLAVIQSNLNHLDLSDKYARQALDHTDRLTPRERYYIEGFYYTLRSETFAKGIDAYRKCLEVDAADDACRHNLALSLASVEQFNEAISQNEDLIGQGQAVASTYGNLEDLYVIQGEVDRAVSLSQDEVKRNPQSGSANRDLANALKAAGRYPEALRAVDRAEALAPLDYSVPVIRTQLQMLEEDWGSARASAQALTVATDPTRRWMGDIQLATVALFTGQCAPALQSAEQATTAYGGPGFFTAIARNVVANLQDLCGQHQAALPTVREALSEAKGTDAEVGVLSDVAWLAAGAGQNTEADSALNQMAAMVSPVAQTRDGRGLAYARGRVALARKDFTTAISQLSAAQASLPPHGGTISPSQHVSIWFALGQAYLGAGRPADAEPWFRKVTETTFERTFDPVAFVQSFFYLGQCLEKRGDGTGARDAYRRFLSYWKDGTVWRDQVAEATRKSGGKPRP